MINLLPKDKIFYSLFKEQAKKLKEGIEVLEKILENPEKIEEYAKEMKKLEREADSIGHSVVDHLRKSFITPLEDTDIDLLRQKLDEIMDLMEMAVSRLAIYKVSFPFPEEIPAFVGVLKEIVGEIENGIVEIRNIGRYQKELQRRCEKINELENVGDEIYRKALKKLMEVENPSSDQILEIIKLKDIYTAFEEATDTAEDVGNIFETILIKNR